MVDTLHTEENAVKALDAVNKALEEIQDACEKHGLCMDCTFRMLLMNIGMNILCRDAAEDKRGSIGEPEVVRLCDEIYMHLLTMLDNINTGRLNMEIKEPGKAPVPITVKEPTKH